MTLAVWLVPNMTLKVHRVDMHTWTLRICAETQGASLSKQAYFKSSFALQ